MTSLKENLTYLLNARGITITQLARETGISQPVLHRLCTGKTINPQIESLLPIGRFFKISIDQLLGLAPLYAKLRFDSKAKHNLNTALVTIQTTVGVLNNILPAFEEAYRKSTSARLIEKSLPESFFPMVQINLANSLNAIDNIYNIISTAATENEES